jgi:AraC-like DNA-binding protein
VRLAEVAARSGYADQAHLSREVRDLAGAPISALVRRAGAR